MTSKGHRPSAEEAEARRLKAGRMLLKGESQAEVARHVGVTRQAVNGWNRIIKKKGLNGLKTKKRSGRPTKAPKKAIQRLTKILLKGALAYGFKTDLWTAKRICKVFHDEFGIRYSPSHMTRLLHQCNLSYQKPARQATEKDEKKIARWRRTTLPRLKKNSENGKPLSSV
jgi:transposase